MSLVTLRATSSSLLTAKLQEGSELYAFSLGFWTMSAVLIAGIYMTIYCFETLAATLNKVCDDMNNYIDTCYAATAQKIPLDAQVVVEV